MSEKNFKVKEMGRKSKETTTNKERLENLESKIKKTENDIIYCFDNMISTEPTQTDKGDKKLYKEFLKAFRKKIDEHKYYEYFSNILQEK